MLSRPRLNVKKLSMVVCACHPATAEIVKQKNTVQGSLGKKQDPISKTPREKRAGGMA
jgi:hypothetical protein